MTKTKSLTLRVLLYVGFSGVIFITIYSVIIAYYFLTGLKLSQETILKSEAQQYERTLAKNPHAPLPRRPYMESYRDIKQVPESFKQFFPQQEASHQELNVLDPIVHQKISFFNPPTDKNGVIPKAQLDLCYNQECDVIITYSYQLSNNQWLFLILGVPQNNDKIDYAEYVLISIAVLFFAVIIGLSFLLIKKIVHPIKSLADWADSLNVNDKKEIPKLKFKELELVANHLNQAFERMEQMLNDEKQFLNNASHELRTPIAVLATNLALLERLQTPPNADKAQVKVTKRLVRAVENMKQLTKTLLWLSKNIDDFPEPTLVNLADLIPQIIKDNNYLIANKPVDIAALNIEHKVFEPEILCKMVLVNLIRNAFQYTEKGTISITINQSYLTIINPCAYIDENQQATDDYGFGLGLELVRRIADKLAWSFNCEINDGLHKISLHFKN